jgi:hypothetical protein
VNTVDYSLSIESPEMAKDQETAWLNFENLLDEAAVSVNT